MSGSEDEQGSILAGFLFGNIDEDGRLENDILDEVLIIQTSCNIFN